MIGITFYDPNKLTYVDKPELSITITGEEAKLIRYLKTELTSRGCLAVENADRDTALDFLNSIRAINDYSNYKPTEKTEEIKDE